MAKKYFEPVCAEGMEEVLAQQASAPPDYASGDDNYKFEPWERFVFTGEEKPPVKRPDGCELPNMSQEQLEAYYYIREFMRGHHELAKEKRRKFINPVTGAEEYVAETLSPTRFRGRVLILTGAAGSGKSTLIHWLRATGVPCDISATTGGAALLVGGTTVDLMFAFSRDTWELRPGKLADMMRSTTSNLIIDEASMIGNKMAGVLEHALDLYQDKRLILVGDWAQAAPVKEHWPFNTPLFRCAELVKLTRCYRQDNAEYLAALEQLRQGSMPEYFIRCVSPPPHEDDPVLCMYATNKEADNRNNAMYQRWLRSSGETGYSQRAYLQSNPGDKWRFDGIPDWKATKLYDQARLYHNIELCRGSRVLITKNAGDKRYVNGDVGTLVDAPDIEWKVPTVDDDWDEAVNRKLMEALEACPTIKVKLDRTEEVVAVSPAVSSMFDPYVGASPGNRANIRIIGYPLRLGWAVTIHKSQGMTLPAAYVNMSSLRAMRTKHGLAYVALSRTKTIETLRIDEFAPDVAHRDPSIMGLI